MLDKPEKDGSGNDIVEDVAGEDRLPADVGKRDFLLSDEDLHEVRRCRGGVSRMGFAIQLCVLRTRGHFLKDMSGMPWEVLEHVAQQLGMLALPITGYPHDDQARSDHNDRIRRYLGFVRCDARQRQNLLGFLTGTAQVSPKANAMREATYRWLVEHKVVRPGRTTILDLIQIAREQGLHQTYVQLTDGLLPEQREKLEGMLTSPDGGARSPMESLKAPARKESPEALLSLLARLRQIQALGLADLPSLMHVHPTLRQQLAAWGYRHDVWSLRRFPPPKRFAIVLCFLQAARAETIDAVIEMQDKLITRLHNRARQRRQELLSAMEQARSQAVAAMETVGGIVLDESVPGERLREQIFSRIAAGDLRLLVDGCRHLRRGGDGSHLGFLEPFWEYTRRYSPALLEDVPFVFSENAPLGEAVGHLRQVNRAGKRKLTPDAPMGFLARRWTPHVAPEEGQISRSHYEMAVLTTLNERLKSGDVTVAGSRRWTDFEDYLLPRSVWERDRETHYAALGLPLQADAFIAQLGGRLEEVTAQVESRVADNEALVIDAEKGRFRLATLRGEDRPAPVRELKSLLEARMPRTDLVDLMIDMDNETDFLRHFLHTGADQSRLPLAHRKRNTLAALIAVGCNIGPQRMAAASGIGFREISQIADWYFTEDALKAASVDLVNYAARLPLSRLWGKGDTCSADGMRFHVPVNILAADYSPVLGDRGVTLLAHTADNYLRLSHKVIPCRLREATFCLDGLLEHETELAPATCYTDTHGFTEVVMATGALLGFELAPRIKDIKEQTLYRMDRTQKHPRLDPILAGTLQPQRIRQAWDETVRVIASIRARRVGASLVLNRLGSYARQNSVHQALAEMGRAYKTIFLLGYLDDEALHRHIGRELNKGEASHGLSRFLCFGKEGTLRGREFEDQVHTFSCLAVLHNAVVAWNTRQMERTVEQLRAEGQPSQGQRIDDEHLSQITPLLRRHINPFGRYHFDLARMRGTLSG